MFFFLYTRDWQPLNEPAHRFPFTFVVGQCAVIRDALPGRDDDKKTGLTYSYLAHVLSFDRHTTFGVPYCLYGFLSFVPRLRPLNFARGCSKRADQSNGY